jgi:hypothetical protein
LSVPLLKIPPLLLLCIAALPSFAQIPVVGGWADLSTPEAESHCTRAGVKQDGLEMRACVADVKAQALAGRTANTLDAYVKAIGATKVHQPVIVKDTRSFSFSAQHGHVADGGEWVARSGATCVWQRYGRDKDGPRLKDSGVWGCGADGSIPSKTKDAV